MLTDYTIYYLEVVHLGLPITDGWLTRHSEQFHQYLGVMLLTTIGIGYFFLAAFYSPGFGFNTYAPDAEVLPPPRADNLK